MDLDATGLPVLTFDEDAVPAEHAFALFHDTTAPLFDTSPLVDSADFRSAATDYLVDDMLVSRITTSSHALRRSSEHLRDGTTDWITVQLYESGGMLGEAGRAVSLDLNPNRIGVVDLSQSFAAWNRGGVATWIALPRDRVDRVDRLAPVLTIDRRSVRGRVLHAAAGAIWLRLGEARADEAPVLAAEISETVKRRARPC